MSPGGDVNYLSLHLKHGFPLSSLPFGLLGCNPYWDTNPIISDEATSDVLFKVAPKSHLWWVRCPHVGTWLMGMIMMV